MSYNESRPIPSLEGGRREKRAGRLRKRGSHVPVARHVEFLVFLIFFHTLQHSPVGNTGRLQQGGQILHVEMSVRAPVRFPRTRRMFSENLLAAVGTIPATPPVGVTSHVAIHVPYVVTVVFVELVVCLVLEGCPPEDKALLEIKTDTLEEETVLETAKVFEMRIAAQGFV